MVDNNMETEVAGGSRRLSSIREKKSGLDRHEAGVQSGGRAAAKKEAAGVQADEVKIGALVF